MSAMRANKQLMQTQPTQRLPVTWAEMMQRPFDAAQLLPYACMPTPQPGMQQPRCSPERRSIVSTSITMRPPNEAAAVWRPVGEGWL